MCCGFGMMSIGKFLLLLLAGFGIKRRFFKGKTEGGQSDALDQSAGDFPQDERGAVEQF